ncbi:hypothetical protein FE257_007611 [Aspergillus nanangensis]|uniref:Uncharacterized protein n=1 Tax=Aspergillus nanangensis TaxID=2582783 RepID=A0AAD4GTW5_ASPNN|nr:hypothetical protein FE257_007611 [Aspergillus nanangensis]
MSPDDHTSRRDHQSSRSHRRSHSRSRSPNRTDSHRKHRHHHRDRDSDRHRRSHRHHRHHERREKSPSSSARPVVLPFQTRELSKRDLPLFEPMFAMYLDIQKGIFLEEISEEEKKGRWKSFIGKWNRGELAEGWYDPSTFEKARREAEEYQAPVAAAPGRRQSPTYDDRADQPARKTPEPATGETSGDDDDDDEYGPGIPRQSQLVGQKGRGPTIPTLQDLDLQKESATEDAIAARQDSRKQHRAEVRSHRSELRHIEDEVAPRAEPGTHERRMEKRRETAAANRSFADSRRGASPEAAPDDELMGSGENDLDSIKHARQNEQRKKNEREIRREEILRSRAAEREERLEQYRKKEDETIGWLKTLAKQRFG